MLAEKDLCRKPTAKLRSVVLVLCHIYGKRTNGESCFLILSPILVSLEDSSKTVAFHLLSIYGGSLHSAGSIFSCPASNFTMKRTWSSYLAVSIKGTSIFPLSPCTWTCSKCGHRKCGMPIKEATTSNEPPYSTLQIIPRNLACYLPLGLTYSSSVALFVVGCRVTCRKGVHSPEPATHAPNSSVCHIKGLAIWTLFGLMLEGEKFQMQGPSMTWPDRGPVRSVGLVRGSVASIVIDIVGYVSSSTYEAKARLLLTKQPG